METQANSTTAGGVADAGAQGNIAAGLAERAKVTADTTAKADTPAATDAGKVGTEETAKIETATTEKTDDVAALRKEIEALKAANNSTAERRKAEDVTNDFMRSEICDVFPRELLAKVLPVSSDKKVLTGALKQLGQWYETVVSNEVKKGRLQRIGISSDIGGHTRDGGMNVAQHVSLLQVGGGGTAHSNIAEGLRQVQR